MMDKVTITSMKAKVIEQIDDASVNQLIEVMDILENEKMDWWDDLPPHLKNEIDASLEESKNGELITHEEVIQKYAPWLAK